jgi:small subunit ribosomal protein S13
LLFAPTPSINSAKDNYMPRVSGIDIPEKKRIDIALTRIYGIGRINVVPILDQAGVSSAKRVHELSAEELSKIQKALDSHKVEGDLRKEISQNITRLREIGSYRGNRHVKGLPLRGQRTRTNARTKRGKRVTIGALKKEVLAAKETAAKQDEKK